METKEQGSFSYREIKIISADSILGINVTLKNYMKMILFSDTIDLTFNFVKQVL